MNELGELQLNGTTAQPDEVQVNGDLNGGDKVNPETGERIQDEKPSDQSEEDAGKFKFTPTTVCYAYYMVEISE